MCKASERFKDIYIFLCLPLCLSSKVTFGIRATWVAILYGFFVGRYQFFFFTFTFLSATTCGSKDTTFKCCHARLTDQIYSYQPTDFHLSSFALMLSSPITISYWAWSLNISYWYQIVMQTLNIFNPGSLSQSKY